MQRRPQSSPVTNSARRLAGTAPAATGKPLPGWVAALAGPSGSDRVVQMYEEIEDAQRLRLQGDALSSLAFGGGGALFASDGASARERNRYSNVLPFAHNAVQLDHATPRAASAALAPSRYINASHVDSRSLAAVAVQGCNYIAAQGPLAHTAEDFWAMVWDNASRVVVMLTPLEERGVPKCHKYWPDAHDPLRFHHAELSDIQVEFVKQDQIKDRPLHEMLVRTFRLTRTTTTPGDAAISTQEVRTIHQVHYLKWPDHQAASTDAIFDVIDTANAKNKAAEDAAVGPMIVHCSAGVGRTGTFCTIDSVWHRLQTQAGGVWGGSTGIEGVPSSFVAEAFESDPVYQCVMTFRGQRVMMVQTLEQFKICYEAVLAKLEETLTRENA
ncbi:hypothetical protein HDU98_012034 [Podochytrium sp. JEL0797]|nr:hypothetical protein HDU98_012034 [Podochytrium sp. JEL0797]